MGYLWTLLLGVSFSISGILTQLPVAVQISAAVVITFILYRVECKKKREDLPLSVMEVGYERPTHNGFTSTSGNGSQSGAAANTGNGSSHSSSRERRESSCSAHTAVMEEDNYQNLHANYGGNSIRTRLTWQNSLYLLFDEITKISQGSFGRVMKARKKTEDKYYAVKIVPRRKDDDERHLREVKALAHLEHINIVRYYTSWWGISEVNVLDDSEESDSSSRRDRGLVFCLFIQMELCEKSLCDWIWKRNGDTAETVTKDRSLRIFRQIVDGVNYIHSQMFIHRDLKPANIFLTKDMTVKIGDFGLVTRVSHEDESQQRRTPDIGTPSYRAPEQKGDNYGREVDIFPLGLILFELLWKFGSEMERAKTWNNIRAGDFSTGFEADHPDEAREMKKMLSHVPKMRPPAEDLKLSFSLFTDKRRKKIVLSAVWNFNTDVVLSTPASCKPHEGEIISEITRPQVREVDLYPNYSTPLFMLWDSHHLINCLEYHQPMSVNRMTNGQEGSCFPSKRVCKNPGGSVHHPHKGAPGEHVVYCLGCRMELCQDVWLGQGATAGPKGAAAQVGEQVMDPILCAVSAE